MAADGTVNDVLTLAAFGGEAQTTDTTASVGLMNLVIGEHSAANATIAMPANSNALSVRATTGAATYATRLLLKADDGELNLGNTTLVALDAEDDVQIVRAMQREGASSGILDSKYDNPFYDYNLLRRHGLAGEKDARGEFLFPLQSRLHAHEGAIWQTYLKQMEQGERIVALEAENRDLRRLLEGRNN